MGERRGEERRREERREEERRGEQSGGEGRGGGVWCCGVCVCVGVQMTTDLLGHMFLFFWGFKFLKNVEFT